MCFSSKEIEKELLQQSKCVRQYWQEILGNYETSFFSDKTKSVVSITLKKNKIVENQNEVANIFNDYFSNAVSSLQIPEFNNIDPQSERMPCLEFKSILKHRRHLQESKMHVKEAATPHITTIQDVYKGSSVSFSTAEKVDVISEIKKLNRKKAVIYDHNLVKILKENVNFFAEYIVNFTIMQ